MTEIKEKINHKDSLAYIFFKNPVLVLGLVVGQLAAGDTTLQNGAALSLTYFFIVVPVLVFASAIGKKLPAWAKTVCYALLSAAMIIPSYFICGTFSAVCAPGRPTIWTTASWTAKSPSWTGKSFPRSKAPKRKLPPPPDERGQAAITRRRGRGNASSCIRGRDPSPLGSAPP